MAMRARSPSRATVFGEKAPGIRITQEADGLMDQQIQETGERNTGDRL
jgi:hypothetical protein